MECLSKNWFGLKWTPWVHFRDPGSFQYFPGFPGVYRVKPVGKNQLYYIGQTGRTLKERLQSLIRNALQEEMPYNDPHTAAPSLWAWMDAESMEFEVSAAPVNLSRREREGLESCLLWRYRLEKGESTACNHGRFHPHYRKSGDRRKGMRGGRLPENEINPSGGQSSKPLSLRGTPQSETWMGLHWQNLLELNVSGIQKSPRAKGIYKLLGDGELLYIGQTANLKSRLTSHSRVNWGASPIFYSYCMLSDELLPHQIKELENDLLGAFYFQNKTVPRFQYGRK